MRSVCERPRVLTATHVESVDAPRDADAQSRSRREKEYGGNRLAVRFILVPLPTNNLKPPKRDVENLNIWAHFQKRVKIGAKRGEPAEIMSFHDDSHILSQLGILDSHERSPKRDTSQAETSRENKKFVDVKLTASVSDSGDDDDEDIFLDRNNLLSSTKRQNASLVRGRADNQTIRFIVLSLLFLSAGLVSSSSALALCSVQHEVIACLWICIGMFSGAYSAKLTAARSNLMIFLYSVLLTLLINSFFVFNFAFLYAIRGFFVGAVLYGGLLVWFAFWRKQTRKLLILLFLFSAGGLLAMTAKTTSFNDATSSLADMSIVTRSLQETVSRFKRSAEEEEVSKTLLPFSAVVDNSTQPTNNATDDASIKKPEVATGTVQKSKTKTEMNAEKNEEVEKKKDGELPLIDGDTLNTTDVLNAEPSTVSTSTSTSTGTTTEISTTTTSTTSTTTTTTTTTTTEAPTTKEIITVDVKTRDSKEILKTSSPPVVPASYPDNCPTATLFLTGSVDSAEEITAPFVKTFSIFCIIVYTISYVLCCLPCGLKPDSKIKKLEGDSVVGFGMRLRMIIAAVQTIIGFVQQLKHFHSSTTASSDTDHIIICVFVTISIAVFVFFGRRVGSLECVITSYVITVLGETILLFSSTSQLGATVSICGLYALWISFFLVVEIFLHVRATVQLAYFLIAWIVGRAVACLFAIETTLSTLDHVATLLFTVIIGVLLYFAVRMLQKSRRLKDILDNSGAPINQAISSGSGEYISLTAQDVLDDDDLDEDEMDRSSMDLDYELEQLGLEPVGSGSRT